MESNNIVSAPQVAEIEVFYGLWKHNHTGTLSDFYVFLTTPGIERDEFLAQHGAEAGFSGGIAFITLTAG